MTRVRRPPCRSRGDQGFAALELTLLAPAVLLFFGLLIVAGRLALAHQAIEQAADDAARSASLSRTAGQAQRTATDAAANSLRQQSLQCLSTDVTVDTGAFSRLPGTPGSVTATVTCIVRLSDAALPGVPGARTLTATASSPLDTYRER